MNTSEINDAEIGDGLPNYRVLLVCYTATRAATTLAILAYKYLEKVCLPASLSVMSIGANKNLSCVSNAFTQTSIDLKKFVLRPFPGLGATGIASNALRPVYGCLSARIPLVGFCAPSARPSALLGARLAIAKTAQVRAISTISIAPLADVATDAWTTWVPYETRETRVQ